MCTHRAKLVWTHREKAAVCKPERELLPEAEFADILVMDSSIQNSEKIHFCCLHKNGILLWYPQADLYRMDVQGRWIWEWESIPGKENSWVKMWRPEITQHTCAQGIHVCMCIQSLSRVWLFVIPWTVAHQAPLSMGFPRQEYWRGLPFPPPGDLPNPGIELATLEVPALEGKFFTTEPPGNPLRSISKL